MKTNINILTVAFLVVLGLSGCSKKTQTMKSTCLLYNSKTVKTGLQKQM